MSNFGQKARSAVIWNTGFNLFRDLLQFGTMLVLVRLLEPTAYGQFALVTSVIGFISIFSFNNFIAYTIQVRDEADVHYQDHFTAGVAIQSALFIVCNGVALCLQWLPTYASVAPLVHVMSLGFIISFPCDFRIKILERQLNWRRLRLLHAVGLLISTCVAIVLALAGAGVYALLCPGMLVALPFILDLFAKLKWRPDWTWSWGRYKPAWRFGLSRAGSSLALNGRQLLELGVLAKVLGFATLGFFNRGIGLAQMFCLKFASQLLYALYPLLTRYEQGSPSFRRIGGLVLRSVGWVVIPVATILSMLAEPVVKTIYGAQWLQVTPLLPWCMAFGVAAALAHAGYMLLLASQRANWCLTLDCFNLAGTAVNVFAVLPLGLIPYLIGVTCLQTAICICTGGLLLRIHSLAWAGLLLAVLPAALSAGAALALCEALAVVTESDKTVFGVAVAYGAIFCLGYSFVLRVFFEKHLIELVSYLPASEKIRVVLRLR